MTERVVEIIVYLAQELRRNVSIESIDVLRLSSDGYTEAEIGAAWSWLLNRLTDSNQGRTTAGQKAGAPRRFRVLHDTERQLFQPAAYGYLLQLMEIGILNDMELEMLIDRAYSMGYFSLSIADVQTFVGMILNDANDATGSLSRFQIKNLLGTVQ